MAAFKKQAAAVRGEAKELREKTGKIIKAAKELWERAAGKDGEIGAAELQKFIEALENLRDNDSADSEEEEEEENDI